MKTIKHLFIILTILAFASSCTDDIRVSGNGNVKSEVRPAKEFSSVSSSGNFDIHITEGDEYEVVVSAESNLIPYIKTDINGDKLHVHTRGVNSLRNTLPMEIYITTPTLNEIKQSGSGMITTGFFDTNNIINASFFMI